MKFLVDAHLPRRLTVQLQQLGYDAIHTLDLPLANRTKDSEINELSINEQRVVVTKDSDFVDSVIIRQQPWKLLLVSTGNIKNSDLIALFLLNIERIVEGLDSYNFVEIDRSNVIYHF